MNSTRALKQKLSTVSRLWEKEDYDAALAEVEALLKDWPGNPHLHVLWASLVQLQQNPAHSLEEARQALRQAVELDKSSPTAAIELGHFLDAVEDDPKAASRAYAEGIDAARHLLMEGLIGQARALLQMDKKEEAIRRLQEVLHLMQFQPTPKGTKLDGAMPDVLFGSPTAGVFAVQLKGPFAEQVQDLLNEVISKRSA